MQKHMQTHTDTDKNPENYNIRKNTIESILSWPSTAEHEACP